MKRIFQTLISVIETFQNQILSLKDSRKSLDQQMISSLKQASEMIIRSSINNLSFLIFQNQQSLQELVETFSIEIQLDYDSNGQVVTNPLLQELQTSLTNYYTLLWREVVSHKSVQEFILDLQAKYKQLLSKKLPLCLIGTQDYIKRLSYQESHFSRYCAYIQKQVSNA